MFYNKKAQAATELAVLGSLIIVAFSFLIQYSEKINRQQSYIQQTFRAALAEARNANKSASYTRVAFRRMPNVSSPMELGQQQTFSSSSNVLWADGKNTDPHGITKYKLNEDAAVEIPYQDPASEGTVETTTNTFTSAADATAIFDKQEAPGVITTTKSLQATDTLQADIVMNGTTYSFTHTLGPGGKYYPGSNSVNRSRSMQ